MYMCVCVWWRLTKEE